MFSHRLAGAIVLGIGLGLQVVPALAQTWSTQQLLERTSSPRVVLTVGKGSDTVQVDTIERVWVERTVSVTARVAPSIGVPVPPAFIVAGTRPNAHVAYDKNRRPYMAVNIAMLKMVGGDEDQLAAVIGHELGHLKAQHLDDHSKQTAAIVLGVLAGVALDLSGARRGVDTGGAGTQLGMIGGQLTAAKFNRDQERQADDLGIRAMADAGFDPSASARLWSRMESLGGGSGGSWLDSHPSSAERRQTLQLAAASLAPVAAQRQRQMQLARAGVPRVNDPWPVVAYASLALTADEAAAQVPAAYRRGLEALKEGQGPEAVSALWEAASQGNDPRAYARLADVFFTGQGAEKNEPLACQYLEHSAVLGFTPSIHALGDSIQRGTCKPGQPAEAVRMFTLAHQRGFVPATARLALLHSTGTGVSKDFVKARALAQVASDRNDALGKALLGTMLRDGLGGPADAVRGFALVKEAAELAPSLGFAQYQLAVAYEQGVGVAADRDRAVAAYQRALASGMPGAGERLRALGGGDAR